MIYHLLQSDLPTFIHCIHSFHEPLSVTVTMTESKEAILTPW